LLWFCAVNEKLVPFRLAPCTVQKFCVLGITALSIPSGFALTVLVFVLLLFTVRLPKSNVTLCICTRFVILVKKE
jgi:hypothetical protein